MSLALLEQAVQKQTGCTAEDLRRQTLSERRHEVERKKGRLMRFFSAFPLIGRGNVLRDCTVDHETVERDLDKALR
jgi:hypothetical protein